MAAKSSIASDFSSSHNSHKDLREENDLRFPQSYVKADAPKKKTTFKITSVTKSSQRGGSGDLLSQENDLDSLDDLDETIDSHTEDLSSEILDSRATDIDSQDPLLTPEEIVKENEPKEKPARFKVVKVETKEPFKRGRWVCCDYLDAPDKTDNKTEEINVKSGGAAPASSVHYVHGIDDPSKNPLLAGATGTAFTYQQASASQDGLSQDEMFKPIQPSSSQTGLVLDPANYMSPFSSKAAQSSKPYGSQAGGPDRSVGQLLTGASRSGSAVPVLPPMQQGETQTSQSLSGNIPFPTPDGRSQQLPILQGSTIPSSGHSQPALSATSPYQPPVQDYVTPAGQSQVSTSQSQQMPPYQQQMLYQDMSSQQTGFSLNNGTGGSATNSLAQAALPYDGYRSDSPKLTISGSSLGNLTSLRSEGIQDTRPALGAGLAQIAVGGVATGGPGDDDITEEASASAVAIDNKIEQAMDLVKSHLMYAVREEVEVLKEVIKELMERMHKVEQENKVLRSEASPETLSRLPPPLPPVQKPLLQQLMVSLNSSSLPSSSSSS